MRRYPSFDEKKLGFSGFKKLMARAAEDGNIKLIHAGLVDWAIMADEETPEGTTEETPSGVAAKPGRRRGGRRRHGGQRDAEQQDTDDESADAASTATVDDEDEEGDGYAVAGFDDSLEETAATDFEAPAVAQPAEVAEDTVEEPVEIEESTEPVAEVAAEEEIAQQPDEPEYLFASDEGLEAAIREALAGVALPAEPDDGKSTERVSDLIVMADHLEHRQGFSHVSFNLMVAEICTALEQGLEAGNAEIAQRWSDASSRDYLTRMLRGLTGGDFFRRAVYSWREEETGRRRQRRTFNLNRNNDLVSRVLVARLGPGASGTPPADPAEAAPPDTSDEVEAVEPLAVVNGDAPEAPQEEVEVEAPAPPVEDFIDDEPQPRNVRRRPFTSRLLRS